MTLPQNPGGAVPHMCSGAAVCYICNTGPDGSAYRATLTRRPQMRSSGALPNKCCTKQFTDTHNRIH